VIDTIGYLKKVVTIFSLLFLASLFSPSLLFAQETISTSSSFVHTIKENGYIDTTATFRIVGAPRTVLTYYNLTIAQTDIKPEVYSLNKNKKLETTIYDRTDSTDILINMDNSVIPNEGYIEITISYTQQYDNEKVISLISKIVDSKTTAVTVDYPSKWGQSSWSSDQIDDISTGDEENSITISEPEGDSIKLIFDENIVYTFEISKSLNNQSDLSNQYEIVLPHDTEFQKVVIDNISLIPSQAIIDENSNYILIYNLEPNSQVDIKISGYIIMQQHVYYSEDYLTDYNQSDLYWSIEKRQLQNVESYLADNNIDYSSDKSTISDYLYRYVVETLKPTVSATSLSGGARRGALEVLKSPSESTPEDYADLFRTLLSIYEIPCIYTIGYVSDISSYQDNGMFHYWLQVYDGQKWRVLDPYLEDYSKVSLINRPQLDHITILNRVNDSISPILPYYSDNDITFDYIKSSGIQYLPASNSSISLEPYSILNKYIYGKITVDNTGNTIFTDISFINSKPDITSHIDSVTNPTNTILLPGMSTDINFHIPFNDLDEEVIVTDIDTKNGLQSVGTQSISAEYSISARTGYEIMIKVVSVIIFIIFIIFLYILIDKLAYRK
jgi:hypothetical protein